MDWQEIETAPRDGMRVLLAEGPHVSIGGWKNINTPESPHFGWDVEERFWGVLTDPTHWMPVPVSPLLRLIK
jgi:hypothetical protein